MKMEAAANRYITSLSKYITAAANNDTVVNVFLGGVLFVLGVRTMYNQKEIDVLVTQKKTMVEKNKAIKEFMWDSKEKLYAQAVTDSFPVPLARLRDIYGEAPLPQNTGNAAKQDAKTPKSRLLI